MNTENNNIHKIYFIYTSRDYIDKNIQLNVEKKKYCQNFQIESSQETINNKKTYITKLYSVTFDLEKVNEESLVIQLNYNKNTFQTEPIKFDKLRDNFIFDFKFNEIKSFFKTIYPPESYYIKNATQFNIFNEYLNNNNLKKSLCKDALIVDSIKQLRGDSISFEFYLSIFRECYFEKNVKPLLLFFKPDKIRVNNEIDPSKYQTIINLVSKNPKFITKYCNENEIEKFTNIFYSFILFFNRYFNIESFKDLLLNSQYSNYLIEISFKYPNNYGLLNEETVSKMYDIIKNNQNFDKLISLSKNIENALLFIINHIDQIYEEFESKNKKIQIYTLLKPRKSDHFDKIYEYYKKIQSYCKEKGYDFMEYDLKIWDDFILLYENKNLDYLFLLKKILGKGNNYSEKLMDSIDKSIHDTGLYLIKNDKLKNLEVLNFVCNDVYFTGNDYYKSDKSIKIVDGINLKECDELFFEKYKSMKFKEIFGYNYRKFLERLFQQIKNMNDFDLLYKLYPPEDTIEYAVIGEMKDLYWDLFYYLNENKCPKFVTITKKLVYILLHHDYHYDYLLNQIEKYLSAQTVNKLYIELLDEYAETYPKITPRLTKFITSNMANANAKALLYILSNLNSNFSLRNFFDNLSKYVIKENDFYEVEENENLILLKNLINIGYFNEEKYEDLQDSNYIIYSRKIMNEIMTKLTSFNFSFNDSLKIQSMGKTLDDRILLFNFNDKEKTKEIVNTLMQKINSCIEIKNKIQIVMKFYQFFYQKNYKKLQTVDNLNIKLPGEINKKFL